jgi:purine nucleoside permease
VNYGQRCQNWKVAAMATPMTISPSSLLNCPPRWSTPRTDRPTLGGKVAQIAELLGTPLRPWQRHVADIAYEIDPREAPAGWPYGIVPIGGKKPNEIPKNADWAPKPMMWALNPALVQWAFALTKNVPLLDSPEAKAHRALYKDIPAAAQPPSVMLGDSFASCRDWHGAVMQKWADDWTALYTQGKGSAAMTNMEDHGIANALTRLAVMGRVDFQRVLILRTGSNFSMPPTGQSAAASMVEEYQGMLPALESAYRVGSPVVHALLKDWRRYEKQLPTP